MNSELYLNFLASPALTDKSSSYPKRFGGRVPKLICATQNVRSDVPLIITKRLIEVREDEVKYAWTNRNGAVAAVLTNRTDDPYDSGCLGMKPGEFEVVEWATQEDIEAAKVLAELNNIRKLWKSLSRALNV